MCVVSAQDPTIQYGIKTSSASWAGSGNPVLMTLYWSKTSFQCTIIPIETNTYYLCNSTNFCSNK